MTEGRVEIISCPEEMVGRALAITLRSLTPEQRREIAAASKNELSPPNALFVATVGDELLDAAWGQLQPGNTAILWPAQQFDDVGCALANAVVQSLDRQQVRMTQSVVDGRTPESDALFTQTGFAHLAELLYLSSSVSQPRHDASSQLTFEPVQESQVSQFAKLVDATYAGTKDCPALNGRRPMQEVLDGYRATGRFRLENWMFVRRNNDDVGVLLLAEYENSDYAELVYMGVVPKYRGLGFGREIALRAQQQAQAAGADRLLVAVDAANLPALAMYEQAGFTVWNRRDVFVRFCQSGA